MSFLVWLADKICCRKEKQAIRRENSYIDNRSIEFGSICEVKAKNTVPKDKTIAIKVVDIKNKQHNFRINDSFTIYNLKSYIVQNLCQSLNQNDMDIIRANQDTSDSTILSNFKAVAGEIVPTFYQRKKAMNKLEGVICKYQEDPISSEKSYMAKMVCDHYISRDSLIQMIRSQISQLFFQIRCPHQANNGNICSQVWDFSFCKKIGAFTREEMSEFEEGLNANWAKRFAKKCPKCQRMICKNDQNTNKITCPHCNCYQFCYICLLPWKSSNDNFCGSQACQFFNNEISNSPLTREFEVLDTKTNKRINVKTPKARMCPHCTFAIENTINCKHTPCTNCKKNFCWICLSIQEGGIWKCGGAYQYCGRTAQIQNFKLKK